MPQPAEGQTPQLDRVLSGLRELVLSGEFPPGTRLAELGLVARLQASRTPVRQALAQLAHNGLLESIPGGGFRVRAFELQHVWDSFELRGVLEGAAGRLAAERLTSHADLARLQALVQGMEKAKHGVAERFSTYFALNDEFHREVLCLSRSAPLIRTIGSLVQLPFANPRSLLFIYENREDKMRVLSEAQRHHRLIADGIAAGEGARVEALLREHYMIPRRALERALVHAQSHVHLPSLSLVTRSQGLMTQNGTPRPSKQTDRAIDTLRQLIFGGVFQAGDRLTELELVARLAVSRTPVRHALAHLADQGLLEPVRNGGFRVKAFALEDVWDAIELRGVLEGTAVRLAGERLESLEDLNPARTLVEQMSAALDARDIFGYFRLNDALHAALWELAKSQPLVDSIRSTMLLPFAAPAAVFLEPNEAAFSFDRARRANREHTAILHAIEAGQGARAEGLMREHVLVWRWSISKLLSDRDQFIQLPGASLLTIRAS